MNVGDDVFVRMGEMWGACGTVIKVTENLVLGIVSVLVHIDYYEETGDYWYPESGVEVVEWAAPT